MHPTQEKQPKFILFKVPEFMAGFPSYEPKQVVPIVVKVLKEYGYNVYPVTTTLLYINWKRPDEYLEKRRTTSFTYNAKPKRAAPKSKTVRFK